MSNVNMIPVTLPRELGGWSLLPRPDLVLKEAFDAGPNRVIQQLSVITKVSHLAEAGWVGFDGLPLQDLHVFSFLVGCSLYYYHGGRLVSFAQRRNRNRSSIVVAQCVGRSDFYAEAGVAA